MPIRVLLIGNETGAVTWLYGTEFTKVSSMNWKKVLEEIRLKEPCFDR
jgi:hypothetical protein